MGDILSAKFAKLQWNLQERNFQNEILYQQMIVSHFKLSVELEMMMMMIKIAICDSIGVNKTVQMSVHHNFINVVLNVIASTFWVWFGCFGSFLKKCTRSKYIHQIQPDLINISMSKRLIYLTNFYLLSRRKKHSKIPTISIHRARETSQRIYCSTAMKTGSV